MRTYLIGYDLNIAGQDYEILKEKIKSIGLWWHCLDSAWIVKTDASAEQIRDFLQPFIDANDELAVFHLSGEGAWVLSTKCSEWLLENLNNT